MARPRISDGKGRKYVREVLNIGKGYGYSEEAIEKNVNELAAPAKSNRSQIREWIEWNHSKAYVRTEYNDDFNQDLWFITEEGIAKESIK